MSREMIEILVLAAIAGFVLFRLYAVFGRRTGSERPEPKPARTPAGLGAPTTNAPRTPLQPPGSRNFGGVDLGDVMRADPSFDPVSFLSGARSAYEIIVGAFASGNRESLKDLLTPKVFDAFDKAITERERTGAPGPELVRLKSAEIVGGEVEGAEARVDVRFEAELAEGAAGLRDARERWTFQRNVRSRDPNWFLAGVAQA